MKIFTLRHDTVTHPEPFTLIPFRYEFPMWRLDPKCPDCEKGAMPLEEWKEHGAIIPGTGSVYPGGKDGIDSTDKGAVDEANEAVGIYLKPSAGTIAGGIAGAVVGVVVLAVIVAMVLRRRKKGNGVSHASGSVDRKKRIAKAKSGGSGSESTDAGVQMQDRKDGRAVSRNSSWKQVMDPTTNEFYYHNEDTDETSWDVPPTFVPCAKAGGGHWTDNVKCSSGFEPSSVHTSNPMAKG